MKAKFIALSLLALGAAQAQAAPLLSQNFDNVATLAADGWVMTNNSSPLGGTGWYQGQTAVFASHDGAADSYIAANYNNTTFGGNVSNWLLTPQLDLSQALTISFWTRTDASAYLDTLELRVSTSGASTDVGATDSSVGNFSNLIASIGTATPYPEGWKQYTVSLAGQGAGVSGRFGFRYAFVDSSVNGDYIGIDAVDVSVPEPAPLALLAVGLLALSLRRKPATNAP